MHPLLILASSIAACLIASAGLLHLVGRFAPGASAWLSRAPGLDLVITLLTIAPPVAGAVWGCIALDAAQPLVGAGLGLCAGVGAQIVSVLLWSFLHELAHPEARKGPRIVATLNRKVGRVRNHAAIWVTALAVPLFWLVRVAQYIVYPPLTWLVKLPKYDDAEWVNVSRHKFKGLVGHDLIWCLYCDWMTGVWSLGAEMLRNVESFWCPIRFDSTKKCANCVHDYPDIENGWVPADGDMADVVRVLDEKYPGPGANAWFGHPVRLTVEGEER